MEEQKTEGQVQDQKRPGLLTVMCILSFIGSGLSIIAILLGLLVAGAGLGFLSKIPGMNAALGGTTVMMIVNLILNLGTLFGAIQMFKLKKIGFTIYVIALVGQIIVPYIFGTGFMIGPFLIGLIIPAVFVVLYSLNLKAMK